MFTINNPNSDTKPELWPDVKYVVYQKERGENGQQLHLQGYVIFTCPKRLSTLKKYCIRAHWEARMGTHEDAKVLYIKCIKKWISSFLC